MNNQNKVGAFNIIIIIYNFFCALVNSINGYASFMSIIILALNLFITITTLKNNRKNISEIIRLIFEIITAIIIVFCLL